ncbi:MAG: sensor histidine kinase [Ignavibacteriales bacterium]|nr:MAG: sensor histidine kinase [Ignavibacteriales bacterium]
MKLRKSTIVIITVLISISLLGLILMQIYFLKNAYQQKEQAFDRNVLNSLYNVVSVLETNEAVKGIFEVAILDSPLTKGKNSAQCKIDTLVYSMQAKKWASKEPFFFTKTETNDKGVSRTVFVSIDSLGTHTRIIKDTLPRLKIAIAQPKDYKMNYKFNYTTDSLGEKYITEENKISIMLRDLSLNNKKKIVSKVADQLVKADQIPIQERVKFSVVDSLLKINLTEAGINLPYTFGITPGEGDPAIIIQRNANKNDLLNSSLKAKLFPNDIFSPPNYLSIYFPDRTFFILKEMSVILALSLLFISAIGFGFIYTIRTIIKQKRFGSLVIDFINNMTHEFKTPISTISLATEAMTNTQVIEDKEKLHRYTNVIKDENTRMRRQVEKILQMAVLEQGEYELDLTKIDIHDVIIKAKHNASLLIDGNGGKISLQLAAENYFINADALHITNIIHNILDNAVKYSDDNIDITIATENINDSVQIKISDKGIGIKEEDLKKIFDKYFRVPSDNVHDVKGFGLGLSYVKLMVDAHKGKIEIKSKYGKGTDVIISFPVVN